jgi:hypothetical protein
MTLIESKTLTSTQASIELTSIPQTFTDLVLLTSTRGNGASEVAVAISFNDSTTGFTSRRLLGSGSSAETATFTNGAFSGTQGTNTTDIFESTTCYIPNYTGSTNKSFSSDHVTEANATTAFQAIFAGLWSNTAAITKITITPIGGASFVAGSLVSLYGVLKGSDGIVTTS